MTTKTGDTNRTRRALEMDDTQALRAIEKQQETDRMVRKKTTETMAEVIIMLDELPLSEAQRIARALGVYYRVWLDGTGGTRG